MTEMIDRVVRAIMAEETGEPSQYEAMARAAIEEIAKTGTPCGVCGCAVYTGLPTTTTPLGG